MSGPIRLIAGRPGEVCCGCGWARHGGGGLGNLRCHSGHFHATCDACHAVIDNLSIRADGCCWPVCPDDPAGEAVLTMLAMRA